MLFKRHKKKDIKAQVPVLEENPLELEAKVAKIRQNETI